MDFVLSHAPSILGLLLVLSAVAIVFANWKLRLRKYREEYRFGLDEFDSKEWPTLDGLMDRSNKRKTLAHDATEFSFKEIPNPRPVGMKLLTLYRRVSSRYRALPEFSSARAKIAKEFDSFIVAMLPRLSTVEDQKTLLRLMEADQKRRPRTERLPLEILDAHIIRSSNPDRPPDVEETRQPDATEVSNELAPQTNQNAKTSLPESLRKELNRIAVFGDFFQDSINKKLGFFKVREDGTILLLKDSCAALTTCLCLAGLSQETAATQIAQTFRDREGNSFKPNTVKNAYSECRTYLRRHVPLDVKYLPGTFGFWLRFKDYRDACQVSLTIS